jgi:threonine synthase
VIATNANDEVPRFLETGTYRPISPSRVCLSNAMNVGHPSNLARLVDLFGGWMDETGVMVEPPDMERLREAITGVSVDDDWTRRTIAQVYADHQVILEPHGAVGWAGLQHYLSSASVEPDQLCISLETAHPAKFPEEIVANLGVDPVVPPSLEGLEGRPEKYPVIPPDYARFRDLLIEAYS